MSGRAGYMTDEIAGVLAGAEVEGTALRLSRQLDRKTYKKVNEVLETLGGIWNRRAKAHVFPRCPRAVIAAAMGEDSAERAPDELERERIKRLQFFQTPQPLAERMADWVTCATASGPFLEPEAGMGRIVRELLIHGADGVVAVEIDRGNCDILEGLPGDPDADPDGRLEVHCRDFLEWAPEAERDPSFGGFAGIAMNPPFRNNQDIHHVAAAARLLKPGGRLAAVVSEHAFFAKDRASTWFRHRLEVRGAVTGQLPPDTFKDEGTQVRARLVLIEREG